MDHGYVLAASGIISDTIDVVCMDIYVGWGLGFRV
jgi:hypothetical protein